MDSMTIEPHLQVEFTTILTALDGYMRRKDYRWDKESGRYVLLLRDEKRTLAPVPCDRVRTVVQAFKRPDANPKNIAKQLGFESHIELAQYMTSKGYEWVSDIGNYSYKGVIPEGVSSLQVMKDNQESSLRVQSVSSIEMNKYQEVLEWFYVHREQLEGLLSADEEVGKIPRFTVSGTLITKSVHRSTFLDQTVREFSKEKNISQKDIFIVALIEFFRKYGYSREVENLLKLS